MGIKPVEKQEIMNTILIVNTHRTSANGDHTHNSDCTLTSGNKGHEYALISKG